MTDYVTYRVPTAAEIGLLDGIQFPADVAAWIEPSPAATPEQNRGRVERLVTYALLYGFTHLIYVPTWEELGAGPDVVDWDFDTIGWPADDAFIATSWYVAINGNTVIISTEIECRWFVAVLRALEAGLEPS